MLNNCRGEYTAASDGQPCQHLSCTCYTKFEGQFKIALMNAYSLTATIITLAVLIGFINARYIRMQMTIAIMMGSMGLSLLLLLLKHLGLSDSAVALSHVVSQLNFKSLLLDGMLSFLLFAGAFTVDFNILKKHRWEIGVLASLSTIASTLIVGYLTYWLLPFLHLHLDLIYCLLFGALISPTDPIAVLATFKEVGAPKSLEVQVAGESLFNDGVAIVMFTTVYQLAFGHGSSFALGSVATLFLKQAVGGIFFGVLIAWIASQMIQRAKGRKMAILLSLALVTGGYQLALALDISGALAMVVAGIYLGHQARQGLFGDNTYEIMDIFWELIDEIFNAILFLLIGFELLALDIHRYELIAMLLAIPFILLIRLVTVALPMRCARFRKTALPYTIRILTWGGLRGGLAVALALSLPESPERNFVLALTYAVVAFAVIVQGITIKPLVNRCKAAIKQPAGSEEN